MADGGPLGDLEDDHLALPVGRVLVLGADVEHEAGIGQSDDVLPDRFGAVRPPGARLDQAHEAFLGRVLVADDSHLDDHLGGGNRRGLRKRRQGRWLGRMGNRLGPSRRKGADYQDLETGANSLAGELADCDHRGPSRLSVAYRRGKRPCLAHRWLLVELTDGAGGQFSHPGKASASQLGVWRLPILPVARVSHAERQSMRRKTPQRAYKYRKPFEMAR